MPPRGCSLQVVWWEWGPQHTIAHAAMSLQPTGCLMRVRSPAHYRPCRHEAAAYKLSDASEVPSTLSPMPPWDCSLQVVWCEWGPQHTIAHAAMRLQPTGCLMRVRSPAHYRPCRHETAAYRLSDESEVPSTLSPMPSWGCSLQVVWWEWGPQHIIAHAAMRLQPTGCLMRVRSPAHYRPCRHEAAAYRLSDESEVPSTLSPMPPWDCSLQVVWWEWGPQHTIAHAAMRLQPTSCLMRVRSPAHYRPCRHEAAAYRLSDESEVPSTLSPMPPWGCSLQVVWWEWGPQHIIAHAAMRLQPTGCPIYYHVF